MKYLLDTAVWLWSLTASERLNKRGRQLIENGKEELYLSAASSWEISIKSTLGKLRLPEPPMRYVPKRMDAQGIRPLPISHTHALWVSSLPMHHNDPFDRLLIAQAQSEKMVILTADRAFAQYDVKTFWCGP
ncbi:MAG TPA: type II toxin-antitoxin system VapC family toxin [Terriglobia bacterium]|nr:type II toxin-antitoxin system VapC family toxin [Terriglobia bacterium]